jgi:uncharacterized protein (DUF305 family)
VDWWYNTCGAIAVHSENRVFSICALFRQRFSLPEQASRPVTTILRCRHTAASIVVFLATALAPVSLPAQEANATTAPHDYTAADIQFVQGMIIHHAQAVVMSDWAATRGVHANFLTICKRIALSQRDEIAMMQRWLQDRKLSVPDPLHMLHDGDHGPIHDSSGMNMPGMDMGAHPMMMSGMLTAAQMRQLEASNGLTFDKLYLTGMIRHHQGALDMVATLFDSPGSGQQPELFSFATDVDAGQRAEMARMQTMLNTLTTSQTQ